MSLYYAFSPLNERTEEWSMWLHQGFSASAVDILSWRISSSLLNRNSTNFLGMNCVPGTRISTFYRLSVSEVLLQPHFTMKE